MRKSSRGLGIVLKKKFIILILDLSNRFVMDFMCFLLFKKSRFCLVF